MARKKPKGWVKEPVRHGLAAKGIKTTRKDIRSGKARKMHGLDTSSGSRYAKLRQRGYSDEDAQAIIYGIGREEGSPGIGVPLGKRDKDIIEAKIAQHEREFAQHAKGLMKTGIVMSLGTLSEKALEGRMNLMTGPRIAEAARLVKRGDYDGAIGMLKEVAGLGPSEVTRRANLAIKDIRHLVALKEVR